MFIVPRSSLSQTEQDGRRESNKRTRVVASLRYPSFSPILLFDLGSEDGATAAVVE
jgi:hypothetical protein